MAEMLVSLSAFSLIAFLFIPAVSVLDTYNKQAEHLLQQMEWEVFQTQAKKETRMAASVEVLSGKLVIKSGGNTILYEKYGDTIRRRVNFAGHEILLQKVESAAFIRDKQTVSIKVTDLAGRQYEAEIHALVKWEGS